MYIIGFGGCILKIRDKLYKKENKTIAKAINIDDSLYDKLQEVINQNYDATISDVVNVAAEEYILKNKPKYYAKPKEETVTYRNLKLRAEVITKLNAYHNQTGISFTRLLNDAIKEFIETIIK